jgi:putative ABC transport system ATP-binding protein
MLRSPGRRDRRVVAVAPMRRRDRCAVAAVRCRDRTVSVIEISGLEFRYPGTLHPALRIPRWQAAGGEHWAIIGPSGCGKSTLLHLLAGLLRSQFGQVVVGGEDLSALGDAAVDRWRGRTVGFVPQRLHLLRSLSVVDNVLLAPFLAGLRADRAKAMRTLDALNLAGKAHARPARLSQGEAQRAAIARAVFNRPALLLADEPTANLDDAHCEAALDVLVGQARACASTLVVATHDARVRAAIANVYRIEA